MSGLPGRRWQDLTWGEVAAIEDWTSVVGLLPTAAVEQHGPHLPLSTDAVINAGILDRTLELIGPDFPLLVLPACAVGHSPEHGAFPGTLSLSAETVLALWCEIAGSAAAAGLRKLVLFNSHGGQTALVDLVAQRLRQRHGLLVARANTFAFGVPPGLFDEEETAHGLHAGAVETSMMLHLAPDLVRGERIADNPSAGRAMTENYRRLGAEAPIGFAWAAQDLNAGGATGDARAAAAEHGRTLVEHVARGLAELLEDMRRCPLDLLRPGPAGAGRS